MRRSFLTVCFVCLAWGAMSALVERPATVLVAADDAKTDVAVQILNWDATQKLIASKKGKIVILDLWSTSCAPCLEEFPNLVALHKRKNPDLVCVSLNLDYIGLKKRPPESYKERVLKFLTKQDATFDNVLCSDKDADIYEKLDLPSIPAVFVYGRDGKLAKAFENSQAKTEADNFTYKDVTAYVEELLKK